jgi:hypothetical protein
VLGSEPHSTRTACGNRQGEPRLLDRPRMSARLVGDVPLSLVRRRAVAEQEGEDLDELRIAVGALATGQLGLAEHMGVPAGDRSGADAGDGAAGADPVECDELLREEHRMAKVRRRDESPEADPVRCRRRGRQQRHRREPGTVAEVAPRQVVVGPGVLDADVVEKLDATSPLRPRDVRQDGHADSHRPTLCHAVVAAG